MHLHADYLFHVNNIFNATENIALYYGPGARLSLVWIPRNAPIDVFLEVAPLLDIIPETDFNFNGGIGVRFFFN